MNVKTFQDKTENPQTRHLVDDRVQVLEALHDPDCHLATVGGHVRARVQGGAEALADLLHADLKLFALFK
jgi:hypothetical protein